VTRLARTVLLVCCLAAAACHDEGAIRVADLDFEGAQTFDDGRLRQVIATREGGRWPWSRWIPFDQIVFERDLERLRAFYRDRGFDEAVVRASKVELSEDGHTVSLEITIDEGRPIVVAEAGIEGTDDLPQDLADRLARLDLGVGGPRDTRRLTTARDTSLTILRDNGYPHATVELTEDDGAEARTVTMLMRVTPGPETRFGALEVRGLSMTKRVVVRRAMTFDSGDLYSESEVVKSQRRLGRLPAFQFVHIAPDAEARDAAVATLPMVVTVAEAKPHRFEFGVGYGTEDRFRGSFEWRNVNFFGNGSQWTGNAKYSTVLRGAGFGYDHPYLLPTGGTLTARAGAWWTNEATFKSRSAGGQIGLSHQFGEPDIIDLGVRYRNEFLTYQVQDDALNDLGSIEQRLALGLDPVTGKGDGTVAGLQLSFLRTSVNNATDPTGGGILSATVEHVAPWLGGSFRFDEVTADARGYAAFTGRVSIAGQLRAGTLSAESSARIPFSERYFLGGSSTLRGWGRFEVSPLTDAGLPVGGRSFMLSSIEVRSDVIGPFGAVAFLDAGNVWDDPWQLNLRDLRYAVGAGIRYQTLVGVARADFGYQLNPINNLRIGGEVQSRRWRIHLSIGHAF
jgi:outer membrane protein assembly complex protein YaeT